MKKKFFIAAAVLISVSAKAQQDTSTVNELDEVIITANKYPQKQSETGKVVTVINRQQLEKSSGSSLGELLNTVSGTTIIGANNNLGTNLTTSIRGASSGNVLILLDGIPVNDPSQISNYFDLNLISIDQIERIEILKGGQSTLYGSDAVAGVINIISRKPEAKKLNIAANVEAGSYQTYKQSIGINGRNKKISYAVNYKHLSSIGFSSAHDSTNNGSFDKDGFNQNVLNGRFGIDAGKKLKINLFGVYSNYKTDFDAAAYTDEKDFIGKNNNRQVGAGLVYSLHNGAIKINYSYNRAARSYIDDSIYISNPLSSYTKSNYIGRTHYAEIFSNWKLNNFEFLAGGDIRYNNTDQNYFSTGSFGPYEPPVLKAKMNQVSPYGSVTYSNNSGFHLEAGSRINCHSEYGNNLTFTLNPSLLLKSNIRIFANLYSAYKTPTLYQLFDPFAGNPNLIPEKGIIAEAGTEIFSLKNFSARATGFYRDTKNSIIYTFNSSTFESKYLNASKQTNYGVELETGYTKGILNAKLNYTYTNGKTTSGFDGTGSPLGKDTSYFNLYRIPRHALHLNAGVQLTKKLYASTTVYTVSKREEYIYGSSSIILKGYTTIDIYGEYHLNEKLKLFLNLKNITNQLYFDILGYNSRRFNFMTGLNFIF